MVVQSPLGIEFSGRAAGRIHKAEAKTILDSELFREGCIGITCHMDFLCCFVVILDRLVFLLWVFRQ